MTNASVGEIFEELSGPLLHTNFPRKRHGPMIGPCEFHPKLVWTNGAQKFSESFGLDQHWSIECSSLGPDVVSPILTCFADVVSQ